MCKLCEMEAEMEKSGEALRLETRSGTLVVTLDLKGKMTVHTADPALLTESMDVVSKALLEAEGEQLAAGRRITILTMALGAMAGARTAAGGKPETIKTGESETALTGWLQPKPRGKAS